MKLSQISWVSGALIFCALWMLMAMQPGAPAAAILNSNMCVQSGCHTTNALNARPELLTVTGFPLAYTPGTSHDITVTVGNNPNPVSTGPLAGFAAYVNRDGGISSASIGTLVQTDAGTRLLSANASPTTVIRYVTHSSPRAGTPSATFRFRWTAPATADTNAVLVVGSNSANGNGQNTGDFISKKTFTATPAAVNCTFTLSAAGQSFASGAATGSAGVTASDASCAWTASSNAAFITVTSGAGGTGNGTVNFSVAANTTASVRTGTLTVAGQTFTVTQAGNLPENEKVDFAQFGDGNGLTSTFIIINRSITQSVSGTIKLNDSSGNPISLQVNTKMAAGAQFEPFDISTVLVNGSFPFIIPPLGVGFYATDGKSTTTQVGSARLSSTLPVAATILFAASFGTTGVGAVTPLTHFSVPIEMDIPNGVLTGVAIANPTEASVTVTLQLRDTHGAPVAGGSKTETLPANGQIARFPNELFPTLNLSQFRGTLEVTAPVGQDGMAVRVSPGQFSTLPVAAIN
ncbi:MAG TPA: BACON domain-containing protein [Acidobacteriota bacterium]|jgi:hypothetical protein